jgi:cytochrome c
MSSSRDFTRTLAGAAALLLAGTVVAQTAAPAPATFAGIGRPATAKEIAAWDIDVRPDFKGLPKGSGSVAQGQDLWEAKCATCHGIFGESNEVFSPLVGGTTADDVRTGRAARLKDESFPGRTTLMKVATVSTLWDYIHRAMPWNAPKSLKPDEVYAVTAFLLNLGGVVPDHFTLSDANIAQVQARMPNRNGMTIDHGLWPGKGLGNGGRPDVKAVACMSNCATEPTVASYLPDHARNAHGNLAEQTRAVGAVHLADTTRPPGTAIGAATAADAARPADPFAAAVVLARKANCLTCHAVDNKVVGPALRDVGAKYAGRADAVDYMAGRIIAGSSGVWGPVPMPANAVSPAEAKALAEWIATGLKK